MALNQQQQLMRDNKTTDEDGLVTLLEHHTTPSPPHCQSLPASGNTAVSLAAAVCSQHTAMFT